MGKIRLCENKRTFGGELPTGVVHIRDVLIEMGLPAVIITEIKTETGENDHGQDRATETDIYPRRNQAG